MNRRRNARIARLATAQSAAWHEAMMAHGPQGAIRDKGVHSWNEFHYVAGDLMRRWEEWPEWKRRAYAFPNPEDRRA